MNAQILVVTVFVIVFAVNIWANQYKKTIVNIITKPLLVPLIILFYSISAEKINWLIVTALFFGFCGDVLLLWHEKQIFFIAGLIAFLAGHILYTTVFLLSTSFFKIVPAWFFLCCIPYLAYGLFMIGKLAPYLGSMKIPVMIYMSAILMMSFSSLCRVWRGVDRPFWFPFLGSLFFIVSDSILAVQAFIAKEKNYDAINMLTYISAQVFIVLGFLG